MFRSSPVAQDCKPLVRCCGIPRRATGATPYRGRAPPRSPAGLLGGLWTRPTSRLVEWDTGCGGLPWNTGTCWKSFSRDTATANSFFVRLLNGYDVREVIHTDKLWSYEAAVRELPVICAAEHVQVVSTTRYNNLVDQHGSRNRASAASNEGGERRNSSRCTPESQVFTAISARQSLLPLDKATKQQHWSSDEGRCSRGLTTKPPAELLRSHWVKLTEPSGRCS